MQKNVQFTCLHTICDYCYNDYNYCYNDLYLKINVQEMAPYSLQH